MRACACTWTWSVTVSRRLRMEVNRDSVDSSLAEGGGGFAAALGAAIWYTCALIRQAMEGQTLDTRQQVHALTSARAFTRNLLLRH